MITNNSVFSVRGKIIEIFEAKELTQTFKKREFVLEYTPNPQYPQYIKFDLQNDYCNLIDNFKKNDEVEVFFDLRGKPYTNKNGETIYFTNLVVWKILSVDNQLNGIDEKNFEEDSSSLKKHQDEDFDDLPFNFFRREK